MDDSWRFRSSIPGDICPTCSTPHFPFCPPPPAFDRNGYPIDNLRRFPPDNHQPFHRPIHHPPFPDLRPPPPPAPAVRPPEHWGGRPPLELEPLPPVLNPAHRYFHDEFLESRKRMRVEDPPAIGNIPLLQPFNRYDFASDWISSDEQRRLNLIRSHGRQIAAPAYEVGTLDQHRSAGMDPNFHGPAAMNGTVLPPEPVFSHQSHSSFEGYPSFPLDLSSQSIDRFVPQERRDFQRGGEFETSRNGAFSPQGGEFPPYERNSSRNTSLQLHRSYTHGDPIERSENFVASAPPNYRHGDPIERSESYVTPAPPSYTHEDPAGRSKNYVAPALLSYRHSNPNESTEKFAARVPEQQPLYDPHLSASYTAPTKDYAPRDPYEKYPAHDRQHLNENSPFVLPKQQLQYPGFDDNRLLPPNMVNHEHESSHPYHAKNKEDAQKSMLPHNQHVEVMRARLEPWPPIQEDTHRPFQPQPYPEVEPSISKQGGYLPMPDQVNNSQTYPPLPPQSPPPIHPEPPPVSLQDTPPLPAASRMMSSAPVSTPATMPHPPNAHNFSEPHPLPHADIDRETTVHASSGFTTEGLPFIHQTPPKQYREDGGQKFPLKLSLKDKQTVVDAHHLFKQPHRAFRPDHIVIILRGLPGSGKSYLAKALRDIEVENGGTAPRIHAMDDYFMIEVEKVEGTDGSKSSALLRGKKQITKKVIEYCYEPEMEEAYRSSMLKAFKKTLDEGIFTFIIVDDRNLRVADFAQFWANAKRSGYEVYLLEASYKDPAGCAARNVHGFTLDDIQKMTQQWEEAPSLYLQLDIQSLFHGDDLNEQSIKEVDMDTDDTACDEEDMRQLQDGDGHKITGSKSLDYALDGLVKVGDRWNTEEDEEVTGVKKLERSKWSKDLDEDIEIPDDAKDNSNALSGLIQAYGKGEKSVHWGDRVNKRGFSITAVKKKSISSLVIGPGSGYNLHSNPLPEEEVAVEAAGRSNINNDSKRRFHEQLLAERESFKAVFDRRRQRIGGLFAAEDE